MFYINITNEEIKKSYFSVLNKKFTTKNQELVNGVRPMIAALSTIEARVNSLPRRFLSVDALRMGEAAVYETDNGARWHMQLQPIASSTSLGYSSFERANNERQNLITQIENRENSLFTDELTSLTSRRPARIHNITDLTNVIAQAVISLSERRLTPSSCLLSSSLFRNDRGEEFNGTLPPIDTVYGLPVVSSRAIAQNRAYVFATPREVGVLAIRTPPTFQAIPDPASMSQRVSCYEDVGLKIFNENAVITFDLS